MKRVIAALAFAAAFATPALAQSYTHEFGTGNVGPVPQTGVESPLAYDYSNGFAQSQRRPAPHARPYRARTRMRAVHED